MLFNLQHTQYFAKKVTMDVSNKTVSAEAMAAEWQEIQAAQRDPARFRPLYQRYHEQMFRFIYKRTADEELTADLCAQTFLKAMQRLGDYSFRGVPFSAWLYRIATNEVSQHFRVQQKSRVVSIDEANLADMMAEMSEVEEQEAMRQLLLKALDTLPEDDMQLIEMRFFEQRPFKDIADIVGITESNAKVKTYRILERLKKKMTP